MNRINEHNNAPMHYVAKGTGSADYLLCFGSMLDTMMKDHPHLTCTMDTFKAAQGNVPYCRVSMDSVPSLALALSHAYEVLAGMGHWSMDEFSTCCKQMKNRPAEVLRLIQKMISSTQCGLQMYLYEATADKRVEVCPLLSDGNMPELLADAAIVIRYAKEKGIHE
jgi:hypothetical protein